MIAHPPVSRGTQTRESKKRVWLYVMRTLSLTIYTRATSFAIMALFEADNYHLSQRFHYYVYLYNTTRDAVEGIRYY